MSELLPIKNFAKIRRGASPRPIGDPKYFGGSVGWVRIADVTKSTKYLQKTKQYVSALGESKSLRVDVGDLIMSICGTIGKPIILDMPACIHDGFVQIYDLNDIDKEYLYYVLTFSEESLERKGQPGTQVNLNTSIVGNFLIYVPTLYQQQKIAKILSTVDKVIETTQAAIAKYEAIKQGMMQDLFTRGIDETGKLRPDYETTPHLYKQSKLGWIPKEWRIKRMDETLISPIRDFGSFSMTNLIDFIDEGVPFIKSEAVQNGYIDLNKISYISSNVHDLLHKSIVKKGNILFTKIGAIGRVAVYEGELGECNSNAATAKIQVETKKFNDYYIAYKLSSERITREFEKYIISTPPRINLGEINSMLIEIPKKEEQDKIVKKIKSLLNKINIEKNTLKKYQKIKQGLMQDLLTGKVAVTI